jgi:hypothetical protein
MVIVKRVI